MNDLLYNVTLRQKHELEQVLKASFIERKQTQDLKRLLSSPLIKVVVGPRRAGKSTLVFQALQKERYAYFNLEDEMLPQGLSIDGEILVDALIKVYGPVDYFFFDEIQNAAQWQQLLNRLHRRGLNIIATGSNAGILKDELATSLTGRYLPLELLPFGYEEIARLRTDSEEVFQKYLIQGGFPEVILERADFKSYLSTLWDSIVLKDIVRRKKIRQVAMLHDLFAFFLTSMGSRFSYDSLKRALGGALSGPTVKQFVQYGIQAYLLNELTPFFLKARKRLKADKKAYIIDNGFFSSKHISAIDDRGKLLENSVFLELLRRGYRPNLELFYYQTETHQEVDFLIRDGIKNRELCQVCYSLGQQKTREREYRALTRAAEELKVKKLTIISMHEDRQEKIDGHLLQIISARRWFSEAKG